MVTLNGKNILVTGGAGFIGSHLVDVLIDEKPNRLVVVDNFFLGDKGNLAEAFRNFPSLVLVQEDAADFEVMKAACKENLIEIVFNLAVIPLPTSLQRPKWSVDQNVLITTTLCQLATEKVFQTMIHFSSSEALGSAISVPMGEDYFLAPLTPYAASKAACDHIVMSHCETFGIDASILRPFNNYGPRQNDKSYAGIVPTVINNVIEKKPIEIYGDGEQTRDFIFVRDTAKAAIDIFKCIKTRNQITNIASGREISINELVAFILKIMNAENHTVCHVSPRPGDVRRHCGDISKAKRLFGFSPNIEMNEGLRSTVEWYIHKQRGKLD